MRISGAAADNGGMITLIVYVGALALIANLGSKALTGNAILDDEHSDKQD